MKNCATRSLASSLSTPLVLLALSLAAACAPSSPAPNVSCVADSDCFAGGICTGFGVCRLGAAVDASKSTVAVSHPYAIADGKEAVIITVALKDAAGNPLPDRGVFLSIDGDAQFLQPTLATDGLGQVAVSFTSTKAETKTIHAVGAVPVGATAAGKGVVLAATATVEFRGDPGGLSNPDGGAADGGSTVPGTVLTVTSDTGGAPDVLADGKAKIEFHALLRDGSGNAVPNVPVFLDVIGAATTTTSGSATATDGTFSAEIVSTKAEVKTLVFTAGTVHLNTKITFHHGIADAGHSHVSIDKGSLLATGTPREQANVTVFAADAFGNPCAGASVWVDTLAVVGVATTSTPDKGTFEPSAQEKDPATLGADGAVLLKYAASKAEVKRLTVHVDDFSFDPIFVTVVHGPPSPASSLFTIIGNDDGSPVVADGASFYGLVAYIADENDNPISGLGVTFTSSEGALDSLDPSDGYATSTIEDGTFAVLLTTQSAGWRTITASLESIGEASDDALFIAGPPVLAKSTIGLHVANSPPLTTDAGHNVVNVTVGLFDKFDNPVLGAGVTIDATGSGNIFTSASATPDGLYEVDLTSGKAEKKTVTAVVDFGGPSLLTLTPKDITFAPGAVDPIASKLDVLNATPPVADGVEQAGVAVTLIDHQGNPIPGKTVVPTVSPSANVATLAVDGPTGANGEAVVTWNSAAAEAKTLSVTVDTVTLADNAVVTFGSGPANAAGTTFTATPNTIDAGGVPATLTLLVKDAKGNPVKNFSMTLTTSAAAGTFTFTPGATIVTDAGGVASVKYTSTVMGSQTITVAGTTTAGPFTKQVSLTIAAGTPSATASSMSATPNTATADGTTLALAVTLKNTNNALISGHTITLTGSPAGALTFAFPGGAVTAANGQVAATVKTTTSGPYTITATDTTATPNVAVATVNVTFTPGAPSAGASSLSAAPATIVAGGGTTTLTLVAKDASGNLVPNATFSMSSDQGASGAFSNTSGAATTTFVTDATGTGVIRYASTLQAAANLTATGASGFTKAIAVAVIAGSVNTANSSLVATPPANETADKASTVAFTATVKSSPTQGISGHTIALTAVPNNLQFAFTGGVTATNVSGVVTATATTGIAGAYTVTATDTTAVPNVAVGQATVTFTPGAANAGNTLSAAAPAQIDAGTPGGSTLTFTVKDAQFNPVPGVVLTMSTNAAAGTFTFTPSTPVTTDANGVATVKYTSTIVAPHIITASANGTALKTVQVSVLAGTASAANSTYSATAAVPADNGSLVTVTITEKNTNGAAMPGRTVTVASVPGTSVAYLNQTTDASGVAKATIKSTLAGTLNVTASDAGATFAQGTVTFVAAAPSGATSAFALSSSSSVADAATTTTLTATVMDANKNLAPGVVVNFKSDDQNDDTFSCPAGATGCALAAGGDINTTTNANGVATALVVSKKSGQRNYSTVIAGTTFKGAVTYLPGPGAKLVFDQQPSDVQAGSIITPFVRVKVQDKFGNDAPQAAAKITLALTPVATGSTGTLTGVTAVDAQAGVATFLTLGVTGAAGPRTLVASSPGLTSVTSNTTGGVSAAPAFTITVPGASTGVDGDFVATASQSIDAKTWNFKSVTINAGVVVASGGANILEIKASGPVVINGTLDASGANGGSVANVINGGGGGGGGGNPKLVGASGVLFKGAGVSAAGGGPTPTNTWGTPGAAGGGLRAGLGGSAIGGGGGGGGADTNADYNAGGGAGGGGTGGGAGGYAGADGCVAPGGAGGGAWGGKQTACGVNAQAGGSACAADPNRSMYVGGTGGIGWSPCTPIGGSGAGGSIGCDAAADVPMAGTFRPGSGGGGGGSGGDSNGEEPAGGGGGGGGGGGAVKVFSVASIAIGPQGAVLANGGNGGRGAVSGDDCQDDSGGGGGGGSGGAIWLQAPALSIPAGAKVQAQGGAGGASGSTVAAQPGLGGNGGLGRIRLSIDPALSSIAGTVSPPTTSGVTPAAVKPGNAFVSTYPQ